MAIYKSRHASNYTVLPNHIFKSNLSLEAIGLLGYFLSLPPDWVIYKTNLHNHLNVGRDKVRKVFDELRDAGYILTIDKIQNGIKTYEHIVYDVPYNGEGLTEERVTDSRYTENQVTEKRVTEKPSLLSKQKQSKQNKIKTISEQNEKTPKADINLFFKIYSSIKSGVHEEVLQIQSAWERLTEEEKWQAINWAKKAQENNLPEQFIKNPIKLLNLKAFNTPPPIHYEKTQKEYPKMTKEEKYAEIMPYCSSTLTIDNVASNFLNRTVEETLDLIMRGEYGKVKNTAARILAKKYPQVQALFDADYLLDTKFGKKL